MRTLIGNSSLDSEILARGGSLTATLGQSQLNESFDQANTQANSLIDQYSTDKQAFQDQLLGDGCYQTLSAQLNG